MTRVKLILIPPYQIPKVATIEIPGPRRRFVLAMAKRPVFVVESAGRVAEVNVEFKWHPGMSAAQKRRSVASLHQAARNKGLHTVLEVSTKSDEMIGRSLSALNLEISLSSLGKLSVECAFQGSKVFKGGGPFVDMYHMDAVAIKRDSRLRESGALLKFDLKGDVWPLEPKTVFYDWLYLLALIQNSKLSDQLSSYSGFTDIEFNPKKSFNTQARSCALFVALKRSRIDVVNLVEDKVRFVKEIGNAYRCASAEQPSLFE